MTNRIEQSVDCEIMDAIMTKRSDRKGESEVNNAV